MPVEVAVITLLDGSVLYEYSRISANAAYGLYLVIDLALTSR